MNVCVIDSPELKELYNSVKETGESYESIKNLVNVWQLRKFNRNKNFDFTELPTKQDIENLLKERNVPNIDSVFVQEYSQEMKNILAKAPRDSQGRLLAPNGKPSNLTERQYAQVRTKAFKEWFGDWENDPANASKVVDENGEPLVVYHGSKNKNFSIFDYNYLRKADSGFFFSSDKEYAKQFGDIREFFLNIKNPNITNIPLNIDNVEKLLTVDYKEGTDGIQGHDDTNTNENLYHSKKQEYVAFRPNQVKSATDNIGAFSTEDNSIYKHLLHKDIISEKDYIEFLEEFELSREKTDDFLYNFITKILQVNPRNKRDKSIPLTVQNYPTSNKVFIDYRTEGTIINRILGLSVDFSFDSETFEKDLKDYIENKWEKDLYEELIKLDKEKLSTLDFLYKEKVKTQHNISLLQNYLRYRENSSKEALEYIETFKSTKRKTTSLVQHIGYELKKKKSELAILDEKIKHYRFSNASRTLKVKNRLAALYNIDNVKELVFNRIKADRDSYKLPKEEWEKKIAPYMSLYEKAKKASKNAELLEYNNPIFENKKSLDEISVNELYNKLIQLNPEMKSFLEFIKLVNPKLKIKVYNTEDYNNLAEREDSYISGQSASIFFPKKNEVAFRLNAGTSTILHELLHSVSSYGLIGSSEEQKALGKNVIQPFIDYIDNYLKQNVGNFGSYSIFGAKMPATIYGLTNPAEFIAELFSNKDFQELLDAIPPMEKKQYGSLLEEIIDSILNFVKNIFAPKTSETALDQAIQLSLAVIRTQYENIDEIYEQLSNIEDTAQKQVLDKSVEDVISKLKSLSHKLGSLGSNKNIEKYLKNANIPLEFRNIIIEGLNAIPSIKNLTPYTALQYLINVQNKGLIEQFNESIKKPQNEELEKLLFDYLKKYNIEINIGEAVKQFGDVTGVYDIINKIIYIANNRNQLTVPEEFGHAFVELMGSTVSRKEENKDFTFLMNTVENTDFYKTVYEKYKNVYLRNGEPDIYKIKKEAIGQAIGLSLITQYNNKSAKISDKDKTFFQKIREFINHILDKFKNIEYLSFNTLIDQIAKEILENNHSRLQKIDIKNYNLLDYYKTIEEQNKQDGGKALEFMQFFSQEMGNIITGSLAYRLQGATYRPKLDSLHDIDMIVPLSAHGIGLDSSAVRQAIKLAKQRNQEKLFELITNSDYFLKIKNKYPKIRFGAAYPGRELALTVNAVYSEDTTLSERFLKMSGSYADRLSNFTEEERKQIYLFDFFLNENEIDSFLEPTYKLSLANFDIPIREKRYMGRAKDIIDYQMWKVFDEYKNKILPQEEDIMYQLNSINIKQESKQWNRYSDNGFEVSSERTIVYTPIGKSQQTYTIKKSDDGNYQIINKEGKEVFKEDSKDRRRVFANLAVQEKRAVVVEHKGNKYVVNGRNEIISVATGDLMKWGDENGNRKAILETAKIKFDKLKVQQKTQWAVTSDNNYEVSSEGDKRFSAKYATFKPNTIIDGVDVGGKTIEYVYQNVIKKSGKGQTPSKDSRLYIPSVSSYTGNITPDANTIFVFGSNPEGRHGAGAAKIAREQFGAIYGQGEGLQGNAYALPTKDLRVKKNNSLRSIPPEQIIESIKKLYETARQNPNKQFKIAYRNTDKASLNGYTGLEMIDMFLKAGSIPSNIVFSKEWVDTGKFNLSDEAKEDFSYTEGYLPLWQEWAKQNPELIEELREKSKGKVLTDKFANTRVSQARALADILNSTNIQQSQPQQTPIPDNLKETPETVAQDINKEEQSNYVKRNVKAEIISQLEEELKDFGTFERRQDRINFILRFIRNQKKAYFKEHQQILQNKINDPSTTERDRKNYQKLLNNLDADEIFANNIDTIINRAKQALSPESVSRTLSRKLLEKGYPDFNTLTEEQQEQKITEDFNYRTQEFAKIQKHWNSLMEDVKSTLRVVDGYVIDFVKSKEDDNKDNQSEGEGTVKDNWMYEARKIDQRESLSKKVKTIINNIPILDRNGKQEIDDLGYPRFMNAEEVTSTLFYELSNARSCEHFWQKLNNLPNKKPWSKIIVDTINKEGNYEIKSQFYQNFRKESIPYWSQIWTKKGKITTKKINRGGKNNQLLEDWKDNIESGTILTPNSIYGENGKPNVEKAAENLKTLGKLVIEFKSKGNKLGNTNNLNTLLDLINSVGIEITVDELTRSIQNYPQKTENIFNSLHTIFSKVSDNKTILSTTINNVVVYDNIVEKLDTQYNLLATLIDFDAKSIELQSFRELGDTYQSVSAPSYLGTLISNLTNTENEEEFKQFFEKEFGQYTQFKDKETGRIKNEWLSILYNKPEERKNLERKVVLHSNRKEFNKQTPQEYLLGMLVEFIQPDINYAYYALPLLSDADSEEFIKFIRYTDGSVKNERGESISYKSIINEKLAQAIKDEYDRILMVNRRLKSNAETITTFDSRGTKFTYFPELNDITVNANGVINGEGENKLFKDALDYLTNTKQDLLPFINKVIGQIMDANSKEFISDAFNIANVELISEKLNMTKNSVPKLLDNFFYNYALANINMIQLLTTDLAYYKNTIDFFKRFKEVYASTLKLDTTAKFVGENGDEVKGSKTQSVMILKDNIIKSPSYDSIKSILEGRVQAGAITTRQMNDLLEAYSKVNVADAQGYRTLKSYRRLMVMAGRWNKKLERSYQRLKNGTFDFDDFNSIFNTIKPFCYSQRPVASQVVYTNESTNETVEYGNLKVPIQIKDSEVVLLAMYSTLVSPLNKSERLVGLNKFMDDNDIDIVVFESGVKAGGQGIIDINNVENTYEALKNTVFTNGEKNPFYIHNISTEDFGIQVETPDHLVDVEQLIGSQIKKLIQGDIDVNNIGVTFRLNEGVKDREKTMNKQEMLSHINKLLSSDIIDSFEDLREEFSSLDKVAETLQKELKGNSRYTKDLIVACSLVETTDQIGNVIKEFALPLNDATQFSRIENLLTSLFKNQVIKQKIRGGSPIQFSCYGVSDDLHIEMTGEGTERRIKWVDCYMPAYTKEFFKYYMTTDENGNQFVDINKVPEELKRLVGYRVPTEARYSMLPLRIKGFLPSSEGSKIMVPADITTIAGSDFDVDKLYVLLPTFYTKHTKNGDVLNYVKYDYSKTEQENSKDARNNELISCIFSILTNEDSADKLLTPGGFDIAKQASYICNIFSAGKKTVEKLFGRKINTEEDAVNLYYELFTYSNKKLGGYNEILNAGKGVTNPITQVKIHDQNATGGALIGVYANHNVAHSMFQNIGNQLEGFAENTKPQLAKTVIFNDKEYRGLTNVKNYEGHLITTNIANFLAASVDNAKDPVLKALMQNNTTANTACLMLRLGIEPITVGLFLNQPVIKEILSLVESDIEIKEAIKVTEEKYKQFKDTASSRNSYKMFDSDLAFNLLFAEQGKDNPKFNNYQFWVLEKFKYLYGAGDYLGRYTNLNKADTQNGAAGPSIAEVINKLTKIYRFNKSINKVKERLVKGKPVSTPIFFLPEIGSKENFIGDATEYGILHIPELLEDYLPYFSDYVSYLINTLADVKNTDNESDVNEISDNSVANVIKELTLFSYSRFVKKPLNYYLNDYLNKFIDLKNKYPELSDNLFFKRLKLTQPLLKKGVQLRLLQFSNVGSLSKIQKEQISKSWEMLNRSDNQEIRTFMNELFDYFFYVGGFNFNSINPSYLTPVSVKLENDNYVNSLKNISTLSDYELTLFKEQFILHHLDEFAVDVSRIIPSITLTDKQDKEFKFDINKAPEVFKTIETLPNYIKIIADNKVIYYEYNRDSDIYVHIKPLGITGKVFEYNIFDNTNKGNLGDIKQNLNLEGLYKDTEEAPKEEASMPNKSDSTELRQQYDANIAAANGSSLEEFGFGTEFIDESKSKKSTNKLDSYNIDTEIKDINDMPICGSM